MCNTSVIDATLVDNDRVSRQWPMICWVSRMTFSSDQCSVVEVVACMMESVVYLALDMSTRLAMMPWL